MTNTSIRALPTGNEVILLADGGTVAKYSFNKEGITYNTDVPCEHCTCGKRG